MAIGLLEQCLHGAVGVEGDHIHSQEVRTVDTVDEFADVLTAKFVRAAINADRGGAVVGYRCDDGSYTCVYVFEGEFEPMQKGLTIEQAKEYFTKNNPRCFNEPVRANAPASATLN
jgi:hypothetical protein